MQRLFNAARQTATHSWTLLLWRACTDLIWMLNAGDEISILTKDVNPSLQSVNGRLLSKAGTSYVRQPLNHVLCQVPFCVCFFVFVFWWKAGNSLMRREGRASRDCNENKWSSLNLMSAKAEVWGRGVLLSVLGLENRKFRRQQTTWQEPKNVLLGNFFCVAKTSHGQ